MTATNEESFEDREETKNLDSWSSDQRESSAVPPRSVRFGSLTVRDYPIMHGDNPGGEWGPAITIEWDYLDERTLPIDDYEASRPRRRKLQKLQLSPFVRREMLWAAGYSRMQIKQLEAHLHELRKKRRASASSAHLDRFREAAESAKRKARNVMSMGQLKRDERRQLDSLLPLDDVFAFKKMGRSLESIQTSDSTIETC